MTRRDDRDQRFGGVRYIYPDQTYNDGVNIGTTAVNPDDPYDPDREYYRPFNQMDRYGYGNATDRGYYGPNIDTGARTADYIPTTLEGAMGNRSGRGAHYGKGPRHYRRSDERILDDVHQSLTDHHELDATDVEITVEHGEVTLSGVAPDRQSKRLAEDLALQVRGVQDVHNRIRVGGRG